MNSKETLEYIDSLIQEMLADNSYDMHLRTYKWLNKIRKIIGEVDISDAREKISEEEDLTKPDVIISCDASITKNPGGEAAIAIVVRRRNMEPYSQVLGIPMAKTVNEAEYDAIFHAIDHVERWPGKFGGLHIHIISDSQLAIYQLKGQWECNEERLARKKKIILETISNMKNNDARHEDTMITTGWKPRCSTTDLKQANRLAQGYLGIKEH